MSDKTIYLLRHGRIMEKSAPKRYIGQTDLPLNASGLQQAEKLADYFSNIPLDAVFCSDLKRSAQTAQAIADRRRMTVTTIPALREIHLGQWDGLTGAAVKNKWPDDWRRRGEDLAGFRPPGGESFRDLQERAFPAFESLAEKPRGACVIVGHAGVNRVILCRILGMPLDRLFSLGQDCAGVNVLASMQGGWRLQALNFTISEMI